jgi:predicted metal-dependent phosphoesterase TrpH
VGLAWDANGRMDKADLPFKDLRVRQALNLAVDKQAFLKDYLHGQGVLVGYPFPPTPSYAKYLGDEKVRKYKMWITKEECIKLILDAGGIPVLAHPFTLKMTNEELKSELKYLVSIGLKGIEVIHSKGNEEQREFYKELAKEFNLITTGGTDYHGPEVKPNIKLGTGIENNVNLTEKDITLIDLVVSRY